MFVDAEGSGKAGLEKCTLTLVVRQPQVTSRETMSLARFGEGQVAGMAAVALFFLDCGLLKVAAVCQSWIGS